MSCCIPYTTYKYITYHIKKRHVIKYDTCQVKQNKLGGGKNLHVALPLQKFKGHIRLRSRNDTFKKRINFTISPCTLTRVSNCPLYFILLLPFPSYFQNVPNSTFRLKFRPKQPIVNIIWVFMGEIIFLPLQGTREGLNNWGQDITESSFRDATKLGLFFGGRRETLVREEDEFFSATKFL